MRVRLFLLALLIGALTATSACTSSNTVGGQQSNAGYDNQYRTPTTGQQQTYEGAPGEQSAVDAPITVMQLALETGDVYPGEDYYAYALVDNPTERENLEYVWSTTSGTITEVPEAERGRLNTLVETKYGEATPAAAGTMPAPTDGEAAVNGEATNSDGTAAVSTPGETGTVVAPPVTSGGGSQTIVTQPQTGGTATQAQLLESTPVPTEAEYQTIQDKRSRGETLTEADMAAIMKYNQQQELDAAQQAPPEERRLPQEANPTGQRMTSIMERRWVAQPEPDEFNESDETAAEIDIDDIAADTARAIEAERGSAEIRTLQSADQMRRRGRRLSDSDQQRDEPYGAANVVEATPVGDPFAADDRYFGGRRSVDDVDRERFGAPAETGSAGAVTRLSGDERFASSGEEVVSGPLPTAEEAYAATTLVTDEPFIRFTPRTPGETKLFMKVRWKTDDLSDVVELPVTTRLREPLVRLSDDFPDMVREDEPVYVRVDGENMPAFRKGLFTISFDPNVLSFRDAELGDFFDGAPSASMYFAQPDKLTGRVLLAIDSNTELAEISGDGPLAYVRFKAKQDIPTRDLAQLALVQDTSSQYVLNGSGDNVLPVVVEHPVFATALVMPPTLANMTRENTPGQGTPAGTTPAATGAPAGTAATGAPTDTGAPPVPTGPRAPLPAMDSSGVATVDSGPRATSSTIPEAGPSTDLDAQRLSAPSYGPPLPQTEPPITPEDDDSDA